MWINSYKTNKTIKGKNVQVIHYQFLERYKDPKTGKNKTVSVSYDRNTPQVRKEATNKLEKKIEKRIREIKSSNTNITLQELTDEFLEYYKHRVALRTYIINKNVLQTTCNTLGGDTLAKRITTPMLNKYFDNRLYDKKHPVSNSTVRNTRKALSLAYKFANRYGYLNINPVKDTEVNWRNEIDARRNRIENKYLTHAEYRKIIEYCLKKHKQYYADAFKLQYLTGLRFGELIALQVKDVLKKSGYTYLDINGTMVVTDDHSKQIKSDRTKSIAGIRQIMLSPKAITIVKRNMKGKNPDDWLITQPLTPKRPERPLKLNTANVFLKKACKELKINKKVTTHFFRHTHVSNLADLGIPLRVIQKRVGHADSEITRRIYLHVTKRTTKKFIDMIDSIDEFD